MMLGRMHTQDHLRFDSTPPVITICSNILNPPRWRPVTCESIAPCRMMGCIEGWRPRPSADRPKIHASLLASSANVGIPRRCDSMSRSLWLCAVFVLVCIIGVRGHVGHRHARRGRSATNTSCLSRYMGIPARDRCMRCLCFLAVDQYPHRRFLLCTCPILPCPQLLDQCAKAAER